MLVVKYEKLNNSKYIPHVDMLRQMARVLRRGNISVSYSQGFNPHELIFFAPPTPLGLSSIAEYCTIFTDEDKNTFIEKFNNVAINGIKVVMAKRVEKNPNFAGITRYAKYKIDVTDEEFERIKNAFKTAKEKGEYMLSYMQKGELVTKDVSQYIHSVFEENGEKNVVLAFGNTNLRVDRLMNSFGVSVTKIIKTDVYYQEDDALKSLDTYFE